MRYIIKRLMVQDCVTIATCLSMPVKLPQTVEFSALADNSVSFDEIIDVRSPSEYALDHLPGASNLPVLDDDQRALVGTLNAQESSFAANRRGASLICTNIGELLAGPLADRPRDWRPLVYCWRGGNRSGSLATVLARIGYRVAVLDGGYRNYRRWVVEEITSLASRLTFLVVAGRTGTGKSRILAELQAQGGQVLDLEGLANHRGSVLGLLPDEQQPSQKRFETLLTQAMRALDPAQPVFVESESRKIGQVQVPGSLIESMRASQCFVVDMSVAARAHFLIDDYAHFLAQPSQLLTRLERIHDRHSSARLQQWKADITAGRWQAFVEDILSAHYDPAYDKSMRRNYGELAEAPVVNLDDPPDFDAAARQILRAAKIS